MKTLFLFILSFLFLSCSSNDLSNKKNIPKAELGIIDFFNWDFEKDGLVELNGEWKFYETLSLPNHFEPNDSFGLSYDVKVPSPWNDYETLLYSPFPAHGSATFRLKIKNANYKKLAFKISEIRDAYKLWVNGILITEHGKVGSTEATTIPRSDSKIVSFFLENNQADIIFQVANFRSSKGGIIRKSFLLGTESQIQKRQFRSVAYVLFLCGCYLIIGIYHLLFYQMRKENKGAMFFAILCFLSIIRVLTTGDKWMIYWTDISTVFNSRLAYMSIYLIIPFFLKYLHTFFPKEIPLRFIRFNEIVSLLMSAFILFAPNKLSHWTSIPFQVWIVVLTLFLMYALTNVLRKKLNGGVLLTIGMGIVLLTGLNDTFYEDHGLFNGNLFPFGILIFMMLQTMFLAKIFATNMDNVRKLSNTFKKFVPIQFLKRLDQNAKNEIPIGIAEEEFLTVSFSDIRSFSKISEKMTSQELMVYLNEYFERMDDPIRMNHGFIDKYIGDSIMCIFDRKEDSKNLHVEDAVRSAIAMHRNQNEFEEKAKRKLPIEFGIGIHTGKVILGTVGSKLRMDSTVIGDSVNLASRLESLTKYYGAKIIISDTCRELIHSDDFLIRQLDKVVVKGKSNIVTIYEVFDADGFESKKLKVEVLPIFEQALKLFYNRNWEKAKEGFESCLVIYPNDIVAKMYIDRCVQYQSIPPNDNWKGEFVYNVK